MHVYLIGMPGSGKSTLGPALAKQLNRKFIDLDTFIEETAGQTIPHIFEQKGEAFFRSLEAEVLKTVSFSEEKLVIATGGGAPCFYDNLAFMNEHGLTVYLKTAPEILAVRLLQTKLTNRPLFRNKNNIQVLRYLEETLRVRETFYARAGIVFESRSQTASIAEKAVSLAAYIRRCEQTA